MPTPIVLMRLFGFAFILLNMHALRDYRSAVGKRMRKIVSSLSAVDLKRKMKPESLRRILTEGGVTEDKDSIWLLDFWGRKPFRRYCLCR